MSSHLAHFQGRFWITMAGLNLDFIGCPKIRKNQSKKRATTGIISPHHDSLCWSHSDFLLVLVSCNDQDTQALAKYRRRTTAVLLRQEIDQPKGRRCFQSQRSKSALQPTWNLRCSQNAMQRLKATIGRSALILCESRTNQTHPVHNQTTPNLSN